MTLVLRYKIVTSDVFDVPENTKRCRLCFMLGHRLGCRHNIASTQCAYLEFDVKYFRKNCFHFNLLNLTSICHFLEPPLIELSYLDGMVYGVNKINTDWEIKIGVYFAPDAASTAKHETLPHC